MKDPAPSVDVRRLLNIAIALLLLFAVGMVLLGDFLVAGVTFLLVTFAIYFRETQT